MKRPSFLLSLAGLVGASALRTQACTPPIEAPLNGLRVLVLSGGVAKGVYEAGVLQALVDTNNAQYDLVCGTSIGALNGAMFARGETDKLQELWHTISKRNVLKLQSITAYDSMFARTKPGRYANAAWNAATMQGFFDRSSIGQILNDYVPDPKLKVPMLIGATNISLRKGVVFYRNADAAIATNPATASIRLDRLQDMGLTYYKAEDSAFTDVLMASACVPGAFRPVDIDVVEHYARGYQRYTFVDGGIANNTPIKFANALGANHIDVVFLDNIDESLSHYENTIALGFELWGVMQRRMIEDDARMTQALSRLTSKAPLSVNNPLFGLAIEQLRATLKMGAVGEVTLRQIRPRQDLPISAFGFNDQAAVDSTYHIGYADGLCGFQPFNLDDLG